jgi:hypothetical protein
MLEECKTHLSRSFRGCAVLSGDDYLPGYESVPEPEVAPQSFVNAEHHSSNQQLQSTAQFVNHTEAAQEVDDIGSTVDLEEVMWIEVSNSHY